jgi:hypothetical protein
MSAISSPGHDDNPARGAAHKDAKATRATHTESEDTVRNLKASESVVAAFQAVGIPSPAPDLAQIITTYVTSKTQDIPFKQMSNMTPGSGQLGTSAAEGVTLLLGSLTPMQREAMKAGVNPLDPGAVLKFADALQRLAASGQAAAARAGGNADGGTSGARFDSMDAAVAKGDWGSPAGLRYMSNYATEHGLPWAANNPELLKLGPAAIQAIADVHLTKHSYDRLTGEAEFKPKHVAILARYAKKKHKDANDLSDAIADAVHGMEPGTTPEAKRRREELRDGITNFMANPDDAAATKGLNKTLEPYDKDPAKAPIANMLRDKLNVQKNRERAAENQERAAEAGRDHSLAGLNTPAANSAGAPTEQAQPAPETPKRAVREAGKSKPSVG